MPTKVWIEKKGKGFWIVNHPVIIKKYRKQGYEVK